MMSRYSVKELFKTWPGAFEYRLLRARATTTTISRGKLRMTLATNAEFTEALVGWWTRYSPAERHSVSPTKSEATSASRGLRGGQRFAVDERGAARSTSDGPGGGTACRAGPAPLVSLPMPTLGSADACEPFMRAVLAKLEKASSTDPRSIWYSGSARSPLDQWVRATACVLI